MREVTPKIAYEEGFVEGSKSYRLLVIDEIEKINVDPLYSNQYITGFYDFKHIILKLLKGEDE